jgi:hydrogenase maturation protein HypF
LSGGTFQNAWLAPVVRALLEDRGIRVLSARQLGPNDGSISYGQAVVAAARQQESGR